MASATWHSWGNWRNSEIEGIDGSEYKYGPTNQINSCILLDGFCGTDCNKLKSKCGNGRNSLMAVDNNRTDQYPFDNENMKWFRTMWQGLNGATKLYDIQRWGALYFLNLPFDLIPQQYRCDAVLHTWCIHFPLSTLSSLLCVFDRHHSAFYSRRLCRCCTFTRMAQSCCGVTLTLRSLPHPSVCYILFISINAIRNVHLQRLETTFSFCISANNLSQKCCTHVLCVCMTNRAHQKPNKFYKLFYDIFQRSCCCSFRLLHFSYIRN